MRKITQEELKVIIENHKHWICRDYDGWENMRADLNGADLNGANLSGADLRGAILVGADLKDADLRGAILVGADLMNANLSGADLRGVILMSADLRGVILMSADLMSADLRGAILMSADLKDADLVGVNLHNANLMNADLTGVNLMSTILIGANLTGVKNIPYVPMTCPECGSFIGFKKANNKIVMLEIPNDAKRLSAGTSRKCRCNKAKVLEIQELNGDKTDLKEISSDRDESFIYKVGEIIEAQNFDENRWNQCSTGIHFFINRQEAIEYYT